MCMTIFASGALAGPPISGAINSATGGFKAVGYFAGAFAWNLAILLNYWHLIKIRQHGGSINSFDGALSSTSFETSFGNVLIEWDITLCCIRFFFLFSLHVLDFRRSMRYETSFYICSIRQLSVATWGRIWLGYVMFSGPSGGKKILKINSQPGLSIHQYNFYNNTPTPSSKLSRP